jgi:hypothetical protein
MLKRINRSIDGIIDPHDPQCEASDVFDDRLDAANAFMIGLQNAERGSSRRAFNMLALAGSLSDTDAKVHVVDAVIAELGLPRLPIEVKRNFGSGNVRIPEQVVSEKAIFFLLQEPEPSDSVSVAAAVVQNFRLQTVFTRVSYDEALDDGRVAVQVLAAAKKPTVDMTCH